MKCILLAAFLIGTLLPAQSRHAHFYRKDYTYFEEFDAFYKLHWDLTGTDWNRAFLTCDDEGSTLFYPKAKAEWTLVKNLTNRMLEAPNVTDIFVGLHDEFELGEFITVDGHSTPYPLPSESPLLPHPDNCITMNIDSGLFNVDNCQRIPDSPLPFVCKKVEEKTCPTIDRSYKHVKSARKCYKVNTKPKMWQDAMRTCFMEGGILTVIENSEQAEIIKNMISYDEAYFVGVRRLFSRSDFYTVKGQKFTEMYENKYDDNNHDCGTVFKNGNEILYTSTADCVNPWPFICEMEVPDV
uniref:C-type lectin domain-containing protein n=1 Tax=Heliothis virescens TaxID=7102 RepID=A0A2A4JLW8_HELVI